MGNLKKVITLHQASRVSGYHQDYLSYLIRKGELKGEKVAGNWFTTEDAVKNYILNQEIRQKKSIAKYFLYLKKINKGFVYAFIALIILSTGIYLSNKYQSEIKVQTIDVNSDIKKSEIKEEVQALKF